MYFGLNMTDFGTFEKQYLSATFSNFGMLPETEPDITDSHLATWFESAKNLNAKPVAL